MLVWRFRSWRGLSRADRAYKARARWQCKICLAIMLAAGWSSHHIGWPKPSTTRGDPWDRGPSAMVLLALAAPATQAPAWGATALVAWRCTPCPLPPAKRGYQRHCAIKNHDHVLGQDGLWHLRLGQVGARLAGP